MSTAAPPAWVLALPLGSGQWRFLVRAWGYGPFNNAKIDAPPLAAAARAKACNATIAARSGQPKSTAAKQALALAAAGWVRRDDDGYLTLASWRAPHVFTLDAAVDAGLVVRGEAGALSWPQPASGATQPTDGVPHTADGATRSRGAPNPPAVHPQPTIGPTHTTDGSQSCLSSLSSPVHEVEAREPLPPPPKPRPAQTSLVTGKPSAAQRSAQAQLERERAEVRAKFAGPPSDVLTAVMLEAVNPEHRDAWVQEAAGGEHGSWSTAMGERARKLGLTREALGVAVLASWERECAVFPRGIKPGQPDRGELWYGKHSAWLRKAAGLGESTSKPEATKRSPNGQAAFEAVMAKVEARKLAVVS